MRNDYKIRVDSQVMATGNILTEIDVIKGIEVIHRFWVEAGHVYDAMSYRVWEAERFINFKSVRGINKTLMRLIQDKVKDRAMIDAL